MNRWILFALLLTGPVWGNTYAEWGVAVDHPGARTYSDVKFAEFGRSWERRKLVQQVGVGGWIDDTKYKNSGLVARDSQYIHWLFGVEPKSSHFYMNYKLGPAILTHTDALLGGHLQVSHEMGFGMRDERDVRIGIIIKHLSDAGFERPNIGRNFLGVRMEF